MVIDTSAVVAILGNQPERRPFIDAIEAADSRLLSTATFVEISIVMESRHGADGLQYLDLFWTKPALSSRQWTTNRCHEVDVSVTIEIGRRYRSQHRGMLAHRDSRPRLGQERRRKHESADCAEKRVGNETRTPR